MPKTVLIIGLITILLSCSQPKGERLTLLCWNVANLFDTIDCPDTDDTILTPEDYHTKLEGTARIIKAQNAHIAALSEVENIMVLDELARLAGYPYRYLVEGNDGRGIDVGLLSQFPLEYRSNRRLAAPGPGYRDGRFSRDCTVAGFSLGSRKIHLLTTHLKSMRGGQKETEPLRLAQTKAILDIVGEIYRQEEEPLIILTGDLNTPRHSDPLNILQKSGLTILNYRRSQKLFYTKKYKGEKGDLDYIIINPELERVSKVKKLKTINSRRVEELSDHYPVYLELEMGGEKSEDSSTVTFHGQRRVVAEGY